MKQQKNQSSGFTLIELLVVIAILAILAVMGVLILAPSLARSRDSAAKADIDSIGKAIETNAYDASQGKYSAEAASILTSWFAGGRIPRQKNGSEYGIVWLSNSGSVITPGTGVKADKWRVCTVLELATGNALDVNGTPSPGQNGQYHCGHSSQGNSDASTP